jgi:hypothetical protein
MKIQDYPGPGLRGADSSDGHREKNNKRKGLVISDRLKGSTPEILEIPNTTVRHTTHPKSVKSRILIAVEKRQAYDALREIRNRLMVELMENALPRELRRRWIRMLTQIAFDDSDSGKRIEALCKECNTAHDFLTDLHQRQGYSADMQSVADRKLVMLNDGMNDLANQWWLYRNMPV